MENTEKSKIIQSIEMIKFYIKKLVAQQAVSISLDLTGKYVITKETEYRRTNRAKSLKEKNNTKIAQ